MLRWLYLRLLWAHPAEFRERFGDDMLEAFDYSSTGGERLHILLDGFLSLLRQWLLRPEFQQPWQPAAASPAKYELLTFQQLEPYKPRGIALAQGGVLAILVLSGIVNAIGHGGGKLRSFLIGAHRPAFGLIKVTRASMESGALDTTVETGRNADDPWRPFARSYFRIIRVLPALDRDADLLISDSEIAAAPDSLRRLDLNHDGTLSAEECGFLPPGDFNGASNLLVRYRHEFMRTNPVLAALDRDGDAQISASEIADSALALAALDFNHDGKLAAAELIPNPAVSRAASLMTRYDMNEDGLISLQEPAAEDRGYIQPLLIAADRNHDGAVTRGELIVDLAARPNVRADVPPTVQ